MDILMGAQSNKGFTMQQILTIMSSIEGVTPKKTVFAAHGVKDGEVKPVVLHLDSPFTTGYQFIQDALEPYESITQIMAVSYETWVKDAKYPDTEFEHGSKDGTYVYTNKAMEPDTYIKGTKMVHPGTIVGWDNGDLKDMHFSLSSNSTTDELYYCCMVLGDHKVIAVCNTNQPLYKAVLQLQMLGGEEWVYKSETQISERNKWFVMFGSKE